MFISRDHIRASAPVLLFGVFLIFYFGMQWALRLNQLDATDETAANELRARIFWGASFSVLGVVTCWSLAIAGAMSAKYVALGARGRALSAALTVATAVGLGAYVRYGGSAAHGLFSRLEVATGVPLLNLTMVMNTAVAEATILFVVSCVALGMPAEPLTAIELRQRIFDLRVLLFSSAALLVSGVLEIFFLFDWPRHVEILASDPLASQARTFSAAAGGLFSLLLVLIYVPIALVLEQWRLDLQSTLAQADALFDTETWQKKTDLLSSAVSSFPDIAAVISPLLAAVGVPLLSGLSNSK
jgi:hypothetical protein